LARCSHHAVELLGKWTF